MREISCALLKNFHLLFEMASKIFKVVVEEGLIIVTLDGV